MSYRQENDTKTFWTKKPKSTRVPLVFYLVMCGKKKRAKNKMCHEVTFKTKTKERKKKDVTQKKVERNQLSGIFYWLETKLSTIVSLLLSTTTIQPQVFYSRCYTLLSYRLIFVFYFLNATFICVISVVLREVAVAINIFKCNGCDWILDSQGLLFKLVLRRPKQEFEVQLLF